MRQVRVDHATVAHDGDAFTPMGADHPLQRTDDTLGELLGGLVVRCPLAAQQRLPARIVGRLERFDRHVLVAVLVPFRHRVVDDDVEAERRGDGRGGLSGSAQRACVHRVELLGRGR